MIGNKKSLTAGILCALLVAALLTACDTVPTSLEDPAQTKNQNPGLSQLRAAESQLGEKFDVIEGEYIVIFEEQWDGAISMHVGQQADQLINETLSAYSIHQDSVLNRYQYAIKGFAAKLSDEKVKKLRSDPKIADVSKSTLLQLGIAETPDRKQPIFTDTSDVELNASFIPWGVQRVGGPLSFSGTGKKAWILDTGIDLDHPDLNVDVTNSTSFISGESADDGNGHGTHVAGIIAAKNNSYDAVGVAAGATVVSVKVCFNDRSRGCPDRSVMDGIDYVSARAQPSDVANISLWGSASAPGTAAIESTLLNAADNGVRFTLIAGNADSDANNYSPGRVNHPNVWTISAYDQTESFASFSNYGNPPIDYAGPGVDIFSLWENGGTQTASGTSQAAPHVAGILLATGKAPVADGTVTNDPASPADKIAVTDPPPLQASVSGPYQIKVNEYEKFNASVSGGRPPYSYQWQIDYGSGWQNVGGDSSVYTHISYNDTDFNLRVTVTDDDNTTQTSSIRQVWVSY